MWNNEIKAGKNSDKNNDKNRSPADNFIFKLKSEQNVKCQRMDFDVNWPIQFNFEPFFLVWNFSLNALIHKILIAKPLRVNMFSSCLLAKEQVLDMCWMEQKTYSVSQTIPLNNIGCFLELIFWTETKTNYPKKKPSYLSPHTNTVNFQLNFPITPLNFIATLIPSL